MAEKEEADSGTLGYRDRDVGNESAMGQHTLSFHNPTRHDEKPIKTEYNDSDITSCNFNYHMELHTEKDIKSESALFSEAECKIEKVYDETEFKIENGLLEEMPLNDTESKAMDTHDFPYDANVSFIYNHCNQEFNVESALEQHLTPHFSATGPEGSPPMDQRISSLQYHGSRNAVKTPLLTTPNNSHVQTNPTPLKTTEFLESKPDTLPINQETFLSDDCNGQLIAKSSLEQHVTSVRNSATNIAIAESISLKCSVCEFEAVSKKGLEKHAPLHDEKRRFACDTCSYRFDSRYLLQRHLKSHSEGNNFICPVAECDFKSKLKKDLVIHRRTHNIFKCNFCDYACTGKTVLSGHIRTHTGEKPYECKLCDYKCAFNSNLKKHIRTHTEDKHYECSLCDYKCASRFVLSSHFRKHTREKPYECNLCDYKCAQSSHLKIHFRKHTGEKPYKCNLCEFKCSSRFTLTTHVRTHTGDKPYKCNLCDFESATRSSLNAHFRTHTGDKPYKCNFCNFESASRSSLHKHFKVHTGDKPYECNLCDFKCSMKFSLNRHIRTHTGEKPYVCNLCDFKTSQDDYHLKLHMKTRHKVDQSYNL